MAWDSISVNNIAQPMTQIFNHPECKEQTFAFWLNRNLDEVEGGEMTLCGTDENHYTGDIAYENLISEDYWRIKIGGLKVGSEQMVGEANAIVDTGLDLKMRSKFEDLEPRS
jgi:hypothetical protein